MSRLIATLHESVSLKRNFFESHGEAIAGQAVLLAASLRSGGKLLAFGNGGSAADAARAVEVLTRKGYGAVSLAAYSAAGIGFPDSYGALRRKGDCALAISTSGNSRNVLETVRIAQEFGDPVIAFTGSNGGRLLGMLPTALVVDSTSTARIQEVHMMLIHELCGVALSMIHG